MLRFCRSNHLINTYNYGKEYFIYNKILATEWSER